MDKDTAKKFKLTDLRFESTNGYYKSTHDASPSLVGYHVRAYLPVDLTKEQVSMYANLLDRSMDFNDDEGLKNSFSTGYSASKAVALGYAKGVTVPYIELDRVFEVKNVNNPTQDEINDLAKQVTKTIEQLNAALIVAGDTELLRASQALSEMQNNLPNIGIRTSSEEVSRPRNGLGR
jgi:hypothetical protein